MEDEISLQSLIAELIQDDNSLANQYKSYQESFPDSEIDAASYEKLDAEYSTIKELLLKFQENYRQLFKIAIKESTPEEDKTTARVYLEISSFYLNIIQNIYLNPISYRLNKLNNEQSIKKANLSIYIGIASIIIGVIISLWSSFKQPSCSCNSNTKNEAEKTQPINIEDSCGFGNIALPLSSK